jgi:hypothetical protein
MGQHDLSYRLFFGHQRMIRDLLREIVGERWVECLDLDSGERVSASFVSDKHQNRESDIIWKFRRKDGGEPVYVYILLELQSRPDPSMPVRFMGYESLFYQALMASRPAREWRNLPLIIPVMIYNGWEPWNMPTDLCRALDGLRRKPPPRSLWRSLKPCSLKASIVGIVRSEKKAVRKAVRKEKLGSCFGCSA